MIQLKSITLLIIVGVAIVATVLIVNTFHNPVVKYDPRPVDSLRKLEVKLQSEKKQLDSLLTDQLRCDEENRVFDSTLQVQYEKQVNENQLLLQQLNEKKNETIRRINSFDSDSLRRAYAE